ncbi:RHS repeat-associated core domain-containing protein [Xanthomonas oryzae]|uniref:XadM n=1 Tax=Xanthomonas oryzae pv. oryzae TaxID=64187 RepID=I3RSU0_XANOO|nr:RHS repeat-associated core domain-containing protein [Xanthomonas oryzae]AFK29378.1 XadM [Xanthomonas oryzae pv. oryzae]AXQ09235.1 type IV secretion protein Rhs [Xanthomonas oryzae pv. oryzae]OLG37016.1 type IV secretion protein Rhs [Xanthomonas oryzae pv. oryzae]OLG42247.1 type IV secretion protein Rhs [Xanthomonas oryzae pv. oryzae]OLG42582.1 type IV secretion protein Rhs [Xanthomonas oryzae pv. oryzae]
MEAGNNILKRWFLSTGLGILAALSSVGSPGFAQSATPQVAGASARASAVVASAQRIPLETNQTLRLEASGKSVSLKTQEQRLVRSWALPEQRIGASLTRLSDGTVLVWGGVDAQGILQKDGYLIDPEQDQLQLTAMTGLMPRAYHTATVLSDGQLLVAGGIGNPNQAQLWNPKTQGVVTLPMPSRTGHLATLQADGQVRLSGGNPSAGASRGDLLFDPATQTFNAVPPTWTKPGNTRLAASLPVTKDTLVDPSIHIALRFTQPVRVADVKEATVSLMGPGGLVDTRLSTAEGGRLVFVQPKTLLFPGADYTLLVQGLHDLDERAVPLAVVEFKTMSIQADAGTRKTAAESASSDAAKIRKKAMLGCGKDHPALCKSTASLTEGIWRPGQNSTDSRWRVRGAQPKALPISAIEVAAMATGQTSVSGQVLLVNSRPLAGVEVSVGSRKTRTDPIGRFVLTGIAQGHQELYVDGSAANTAGREYGQFVVGIDLQAGQLTRLPYTMYMPQISARDKTRIASPLKQDVVVTHPDIPGLQIHIPAGTVIRDRKGNLVHELAIVPTPVNRAPFPLPANYPMYFTLEPGGALIQGLTPQAAQGVQVLYPNYDKLATGTQANFWIYQPSEGWRVYGKGRVTSDGTRIAPEAGVGLYQAMGASYSVDTNSPPPEPNKPPVTDGCGCDGAGAGATAGDPIDLYTGEFSYDETDAVVRGLVPISISRSYRPNDTISRDFGIGTAASFHYTMYSATTDYNQLQLVLPNGAAIPFDRLSGSGLAGRWAQSGSISGYAGATIEQGTASGHGYLLTLRDGSKMYFNQYSPNRLEWTTDRFGNRVDYVYDAGLVSRIVSANGRYLDIDYDSDNRISTIADPLGNTWSYVYDSYGYLSSLTRADGSMRKFTYKRRAATNTLPLQVRLESIYDGKNQRVLLNGFESANGSWTGRVVKQTQADGGVLMIDYAHVDGSTTGVLVTKPDGSARRVVFDQVSHYPLTDTQAYGTALAQTTTYERSAGGQITARIDALGRRTEYRYDSAGRTTQIKAMAGTTQVRTTTLSYTVEGDLATIVDPLNRKTSFGYTQRCLTSVTNPLGKVSKATCNAAGQRLSMADPLGHTTTLTWTGEDLTQVSDALGRNLRFRYDALGRMIASADAQGNLSRREYDPLSRVVKSIDPLGNVVETGFDANGNVTAILLPHGNGVTYTYDTRDRRVSRTDALDQVERWVYDTMDRVVRYTDRRTRVTTYAYDTLGRLTTTTLPGMGGTLAASYDSGNRMVALADSLSGTLSWTYDSFDELTQANGPQGMVGYTYDAVGRRTGMQADTQAQVLYSYDVGDRLTGISQGSESVSFAYDNANRLTSQTLPNQVQTVYTYNNANQMTGLAWGKAGQTALGSLGYGYDSIGQLVAQTGTHAPQALPPSSSGNVFDDNNRQTQASTVALSYDANGNLLSDGSRTYVWDDRDRLSQIQQGGTTIASFSYDALGRRISRSEAGTTTNYLYDGQNVVQETQGSTVNPILTGLGIDQRYARNDTGGRTYFLTDMLGSTRLLTDAGGSAVQRYEYDPYGATSQTSTAYTNPYQYTGREKDINGLYYYRARYYRPDLGGFISEDPIQLAGGVNQYMYVNGNPIINVDPFGLRVDLIKMIDYMNAHANRKSKGQCAKYVRQGLEAGGADTSGHPIAAADYGPTLEKNDFSPIDPSAAPESGDITVFPAIPGHPYGHIEAYDGSSYVSDFSQSNFYPSPAYEGSGPVTYRLNPGPSL